MTVAGTTPFPLGFYIGASTLSAAGQASFLTAYDAFTSLMGTTPAFEDVFINQTLPTSEWLTQAESAEAIFAGTPELKNTIPVIGLPMASSAAGSETADQMFQAFAAGDYDSMITALVRQWAAAGYTTQYWRPGWEMNLKAQPWYVGANAQTQADYIAAFQHIYTVLHAAGTEYGVDIQVVWNPASNASYTGLNINNIYPGNNYVDVIAADDYSGEYPTSLYDWTTYKYDTSYAQWAANPANLIHDWDYPAANPWTLDASNGTSLSLPQLLAMAVADHKPVAIAEAGAGSGNTSNDLPADDPYFPQWLAQTLQASGATVDFVTIWDDGADAFTGAGTSKPLEAAAWAQYFGVPPGSVAGIVTLVGAGGVLGPDAGITVTLLTASGSSLASAVTNSQGAFSFTGLAAGTYQVRYTAAAGTALEAGSEADAETGLSPQLTLTSGQAFTLPTETVVSNPASLTGTVLFQGVGQAGVTVALINAAGTVLSTTTTAATGGFTFGGLLAGTYQVRTTAPAGEIFQSGGSVDPATGLSSAVTVALGQTRNLPAAQLVVPPQTIISGSVVLAGVGKAGVSVVLHTSAGTTVATTATGNGGAFAFSGLAAGTYQVQFTAPSGTVLMTGSEANSATGLTAPVPLTVGQTVALPAETLLTNPATISGKTLHFGGATDPSYGGAEAGVTVSLINAAGSTIASTTTGSTGYYAFTDLAAGTYQVFYTAPAGQAFKTGTTGLTAPITVAAGQSSTAASGELVSVTVLTGQVQFNGAGQAGVTVALLAAGGTTVQTTSTEADGSFSFTGMPAGSYQVRYVAPSGELLQSLPNGTIATGLSETVTLALGQPTTLPVATLVAAATISGSVDYQGIGAAGVLVTLVDASGNDLTTSTTGTDGSFGFGGLAAGAYQVVPTPPANEILAAGQTEAVTLVAGQADAMPPLTLVPALATLSGSVTLSGSFLAGVTVSLISGGAVVATTTTSSAGVFSFTGLAAGSYQVQYTAPAATVLAAGSAANVATGLAPAVTLVAGQVTTLPTEALLPAPATISGKALHFGGATDPSYGGGDAGITVSLLNAAGATIASLSTQSTGYYAFTNLAAGTYQVLYTAPSGQAFKTGTTGLTAPITVAAGQSITAASAELVSVTVLTGQVQYNGAGQAGVTVALLAAGGTTVQTTSTEADGSFSFTGMPAGSYQVRYSIPSGELLQSLPNGTIATALSETVTLALGQPTALPVATLVAAATISGNVDDQGIGAAGVAVSLISGGAVVATTATNSAGVFSFTGLAAGSYQVQYTPPAATVLAAGSVANVATGLAPAVTLVAGQVTTLPTEALLPTPAVITGKALHFGAATDPSYGTGEAGVQVSLLTAAGSVIASAVSIVSGWFDFTGVTPGTYQLRYTAPAGQEFVGGGSGITAPFTLAAGQTFAAPNGDLMQMPTAASVPVLGTLSGSVTLAGAAATSVVVSLANIAGSVIATTTTNSAGSFSFGGLAAGSYEVKYTAPAGAVLATGSEANPSTGYSAAVTLGVGQTLTLPVEAMLTNPATITGKALHFGGVNDPSYGGSDAGVTVSLLNASGSVIASGTTLSTGYFAFTDIAPGSYQVLYTPPAGQAIEPGTSGLTAAFTVASGTTVTAPSGALMSALTMNGSGLTVSESAGSYVVTGTTSNSTLTLGNGNQTVILTGTGNTITVGTGTSTITAGAGDDVVHAAGGHVTIIEAGSGNLFDAGPGMSFLDADGSAGNIFVTNQAASGTLTDITGFTLADTLDLQRTLASSTLGGNLANIASYITSAVSNGSTTLSVDPTGGHGMSVAFAVLTGVQTSISALLASHSLSLT
jgi:hypothetical protein